MYRYLLLYLKYQHKNPNKSLLALLSWKLYRVCFLLIHNKVITYYTMHKLREKLLAPIEIRQWSRRIKNVIFRIKL